MADVLKGTYVAPGSSSLCSGPGTIHALIASHENAAARSVTFYDDTAATPGTEVLVLYVHPNVCPWYVRFPTAEGIRFETALYVVANCALQIWVIQD